MASITCLALPKVLREIDRHRHVAVLALELSQKLRVSVGTLSRALQHQPGRSARRQWPVLQLDDTRERLARALLARLQPLRLAQTLGITCLFRRLCTRISST